jgi:putative selenium metabolism protein SsnA
MLLIGNGRLVTRDPNAPFIDRGAVLTDGAAIEAVGDTAGLRAAYPGAEFLDARGGVIMPGFINAHEHIYSSFARGLFLSGYNPKDFTDILEGMWWRIDRCLTNEDTRWSAYASYLDCIKNGVTTVFDHHASYGEIEGSLFTLSAVAKELGVRTCLCYEVSDRDGEGKMKAGVAENEAFITYAKGDPMQAGMMGMHAAFTLSDATLQYCREHTPAGTGFHIHVAEGIADVRHSLREYGVPIVERLWQQEILGEQTIAAHCIHVNAREMDILKYTGTMVVHNPESNMGNAVGCEPMRELFRRGILLGLGTDGYTHDMLESYKVGSLIHKHNLCDPTVAWAELPAMLFDNNPKIAGRYFETPVGVLKAGAAADIIVTDYDPLTPMDGNNCNGHILFGMTGRHVTATVCSGKVLMKDRQVLICDEAEVWASCRKQAADFWRRVNV